MYCRPHVVDPSSERVQGGAARPPAHGPEQVSGHVRPHVPLGPARRARHQAGRGAVLHRRQFADVPDHSLGVDPGGDQRGRPRLRPPQMARVREGLPPVRRERPHRGGPMRAITDSHAVADIFERRYGRRIGVVPYGVEDPGYDGTETLERLGLEPRKYILFVGRLEPENNPHLLVEAFSRISAENARDEARDRRRCAIRRRLHPPGLADRRSAGRVPGLRVRPRLLGASAPRLPVLRPDRGRRYAPGDPRGDGGG